MVAVNKNNFSLHKVILAIILFLLLMLSFYRVNSQKDSVSKRIATEVDTIVVVTRYEPTLPNTKINISDWGTLLASIATLVTAFLTYFLLRETQKTLKLGFLNAKKESERLESESISKIHQNFKNTFISMLDDSDSMKKLAKAEGLSKKKVKMGFYSSFLINNSYEIYNLYSKKLISNEEWESILPDIILLFEYPFVINRWNEIKKYYTKDFQALIDSQIKQKEK